MKDEAVKIMSARTGADSYSAKDIQWVLTVPAIWTPAAKQFMREAAYKVGCFLDLIFLEYQRNTFNVYF